MYWLQLFLRLNVSYTQIYRKSALFVTFLSVLYIVGMRNVNMFKEAELNIQSVMVAELIQKHGYDTITQTMRTDFLLD